MDPSKQCQAITRYGSRCTREALSGGKYCTQHQDMADKGAFSPRPTPVPVMNNTVVPRSPVVAPATPLSPRSPPRSAVTRPGFIMPTLPPLRPSLPGAISPRMSPRGMQTSPVVARPGRVQGSARFMTLDELSSTAVEGKPEVLSFEIYVPPVGELVTIRTQDDGHISPSHVIRHLTDEMGRVYAIEVSNKEGHVWTLYATMKGWRETSNVGHTAADKLYKYREYAATRRRDADL